MGGYDLLRRLGAGGMGEVYLARDARLERDVAIKLLPAAFSRDPESLTRFRKEALALAALNHPNIATIYGFEDTPDGGLALALEYVEGESLAARLERGAMPPAEALSVCAQVTEALEVAHERGVVHRDLKPGNIMLAPRGLVKVLDFGLALRTKGLLGLGVAPPVAPAGAAAIWVALDRRTLAHLERRGMDVRAGSWAGVVVAPGWERASLRGREPAWARPWRGKCVP